MNTPIDSLSSPRAGLPLAATTAVAVPASNDSAVSWGAIFAGAAVAAALSLILLLLGTGFGLSAVSPWSFEGVSAETFGWTTIAWISFTSLFASGLGGYIAGRLRTRWVSLHGDETYFRDTAHGLLAWCVATLFTAALLTSTVGAILGMGAKAGASVAGGLANSAAMAGAAGDGAVANGDEADGVTGYFVDSLLRPGTTARVETAPVAAPLPGESMDPAMPAPTVATDAEITSSSSATDTAPLRAEVGRIIANSLRSGTLSTDDTQYLGRLVAERSGLSQSEAEARVTEIRARLQTALDDAETAAKKIADDARKAAAHASLWLFITLLMGAFAASLLATYGGRQRDN